MFPLLWRLGSKLQHAVPRNRIVSDHEPAWDVANRIFAWARPYRRKLVASLVATALSTVIAVVTALLAGNEIALILGHDSISAVVKVAVVIAGLALIDTMLGLLSSLLLARVGEGLIYDMRTTLFDHSQQMGVTFFAQSQTGALVSRINNDVVGAKQAFTSTLVGILANVIGLALTASAMFTLSWQVSLLALTLLPVFLLPTRAMVGKLRSLMREKFEIAASMNNIANERFNVSGALLVALFGRPNDEHSAFAERARRVRDIGISSAIYGQFISVALTLATTLALSLTYGAGGFLVLHGSLNAGSVVTLALLLPRLYAPLADLLNARIDIDSALLSFHRVFDVLDMRPLVADKPGVRPLPPTARSIEFCDVHFAFPNADHASSDTIRNALHANARQRTSMLHGVSFRVEPGRVVALVGPSGAGKSTICQLILRIYDVDSGAVRLGGFDVRDVQLQSIRDAIGLVTQDSHLFHETIRTNLRYAKTEATEEQILEALRSAQISKLVSRLPEGLDTVVGDEGYRLSGGEKQRIAIARVLLKAPDIIILDEATAHLDSESELAVQIALTSALANRTAIIIAHRLSTVIMADEILVLESGRIVERGKHQDLVDAGGLYTRLYRTQFKDKG